MIKLVINADDYGIAENQTEAILVSFKKGIITSTTIMVNMPDFSRAVTRARECGVFDKVGLHLNLTEGIPLTEQIKNCPRFCSSDGKFNGVFHRSKWRRFFLSAEEKLAVAKEAEAQMRLYLDTGFPLLHLDSHHHSHTDPGIACVVLPIARRLGFHSVRMSRNMPRKNYGLAKKLYKAFVNGIVCKLGFSTTNFFGSVADFDFAVSRISPDCSAELMVHPSLQKYGRLDIEGELMDMHTPMSEIIDVLRRHCKRYVLVSYGSAVT